MKTLQKLTSVQATVHNPFNLKRHLVSRDIFKQKRSAALAEWSAVTAQRPVGFGFAAC